MTKKNPYQPPRIEVNTFPDEDIVRTSLNDGDNDLEWDYSKNGRSFQSGGRSQTNWY